MAIHDIHENLQMIINTAQVNAAKAAVLSNARELASILDDIEEAAYKAMDAWQSDYTAAAKKDMATYITNAREKQETMYNNLKKYMDIVVVVADDIEKFVKSNADLFD